VLTEAERYTAFYPDRAARIWVAGGLPANMEFGPPESSMVAGIAPAPPRSANAR